MVLVVPIRSSLLAVDVDGTPFNLLVAKSILGLVVKVDININVGENGPVL